MTDPRDGSWATGLHWHGGNAALTVINNDGDESSCPVRVGDPVSWRVHGPRRCVGVWLATAGRRQQCPHQVIIDRTGSQSQCPGCAGRDPGRALARDATPNDPRTFALYLAWYGDGLLKVGLTAAERGSDRLTEQGALAFTWLCRGPFQSIRAAEQQVAATAVARERLHRNTKIAAYRRPGDSTLRHDQLAAAHQRLTTLLDWPPERIPAPLEIHDHTALFGLADPIAWPTQQITDLADDAVLAGSVTCLAGQDAIIAIDSVPTLIDLRLLAGRQLTAGHGPGRGLTFRSLTMPGTSQDDHAQQALF